MQSVAILKLSVVGGVCAVGGIAGGIAQSSAATHPRTVHRTGVTWPTGRSEGGPPVGWAGGPASLEFRAVHATAIEPAAGGGYERVVYNAGTVSAVGADSLTVHEGSPTVTYARPTLVLTGTTTVWLNGRTSRLSALSAPDQVAVIQSSSGTNTVLATTSKSGTALRSPGTYGPAQRWGQGQNHGWTGHRGWAGRGGWPGQDRGRAGWNG